MIEHVQFYQKQGLKKDTRLRCGYSLHHLEICTNYTFMILTALQSQNRTSNLWKNLITKRKVDKHMSHVGPLCWQIVIHKVSLPFSIQATGTHTIHTEHKLYSSKFHTTLAYQPLNNILSVLSIHIQYGIHTCILKHRHTNEGTYFDYTTPFMQKFSFSCRNNYI